MFDGAKEDSVACSNARTASVDRELAADPARSFNGHDEGSARRGGNEKKGRNAFTTSDERAEGLQRRVGTYKSSTMRVSMDRSEGRSGS
jgi:hypothetical protein